MKLIPDYPNYAVHFIGRIVNIKTGRTLRMSGTIGYNTVVLYNDKGHKRFKVSRLVAKAFVENPNNYPIVNHLDTNKLNDYYTNLEWDTHSGNTLHAYSNNLINRAKPKDYHSLNAKKLKVLNRHTGVKVIYRCIKEAAKDLNIKPRRLRLYISGKRVNKLYTFKILKPKQKCLLK
jgi:hypothetical protein